MSFSNYKTIGAVVKEFQLTYTEVNFVMETAFNISDYFREDLQIMMAEGVVDNSEFAVCENLVYPVLKEVWKTYRSKFVLWSHEFLNCDTKLSGFPEYILAKRSPQGKVVFDKPYLLLVEAKQDKFDEGWAQCLAEMVAAQRLNDELQLTIFGIVSNGDRWQFGKLEANLFTRNKTYYTIQELDKLFSAVNYVFQQCEIQLNELVAA
ncbi:MAG TPA: hypothetical protein DEG17_15715 [Cyanobacteria bacterium UBA11149]|nr:hypothetical protein [Cyanobacteria bacterium UBA11367]HBE60801.1 hypothetical protein [Cyanobacteria bacterium UBA11366]HBK66412.1 hypothetical protein [Cyanobacteria bacterium UBA11166]HBS72206.1 hypothetical protein [Cyanobacteria bacterium UBA11153]HBW90278.1 hypothetical protein [Cyanobacteria bacterium UBA11149]HCA98190.1 hypothetical protein [Cyanobacteria bacterium UBA9226]